MDLNFLQQITLANNESVPVRTRVINKVPTNGADLRLFADGSVYPSPDFVDQYNLQYKPKDESQNAIDIVDSHQWGNYPKDQPRIILVGFTEKSDPKTDLFSLCKYDSGGVPIGSVISQGSKNQKLLELVNAVYGPAWMENAGHIDLSVGAAYPLVTNDGIYYVPKEITKGKNAGEVRAERREYGNGLYPLVPYTETEEEEPATEERAHA